MLQKIQPCQSVALGAKSTLCGVLSQLRHFVRETKIIISSQLFSDCWERHATIYLMQTLIWCPFTEMPFANSSFSSSTNSLRYPFESVGLKDDQHQMAIIMGLICGIPNTEKIHLYFIWAFTFFCNRDLTLPSFLRFFGRFGDCVSLRVDNCFVQFRLYRQHSHSYRSKRNGQKIVQFGIPDCIQLMKESTQWNRRAIMKYHLPAWLCCSLS